MPARPEMREESTMEKGLRTPLWPTRGAPRPWPSSGSSHRRREVRGRRCGLRVGHLTTPHVQQEREGAAPKVWRRRASGPRAAPQGDKGTTAEANRGRNGEQEAK